MTTNDPRGQLPLNGVRVAEFCEVAAGPFCGMLLADLGADVIKIERPGTGDTLRQWPPLSNGFSENFASLNRNKRSVQLDLKNGADRAKAQRIACASDVVVENYRPGVLSNLGLGYADLSALNRKLVYCSISAFGQSGPRRHEGGFDLTIQAFSGVMSVTGEPGGAPVKCGVPIADFATGLYGAYSIAACLREAARSGLGTHIDLSMLAATVAIAALQTSEYFGNNSDPKPLGSAHPRNAPYEAFRAADGYLAVAAGNDKLWKTLCMLIEERDLAADPRFSSTSLRASNQTALKNILEKKFATADVASWLSLFSNHGIPCAPINRYSEVLDDPQVRENGWVGKLTLPSGRETSTFLSPIKLNSVTPGIYRAPPTLGEHTEEVLSELDRATTAAVPHPPM